MKTKTVEEKLENILRKYYSEEEYHVEKAIKDILKIVPKVRLLCTCGTECLNLKNHIWLNTKTGEKLK
jgi:hypothetical protein